jgi:hypothetical protein
MRRYTMTKAEFGNHMLLFLNAKLPRERQREKEREREIER